MILSVRKYVKIYHYFVKNQIICTDVYIYIYRQNSLVYEIHLVSFKEQTKTDETLVNYRVSLVSQYNSSWLVSIGFR